MKARRDSDDGDATDDDNAATDDENRVSHDADSSPVHTRNGTTTDL